MVFDNLERECECQKDIIAHPLSNIRTQLIYQTDYYNRDNAVIAPPIKKTPKVMVLAGLNLVRF